VNFLVERETEVYEVKKQSVEQSPVVMKILFIHSLERLFPSVKIFLFSYPLKTPDSSTKRCITFSFTDEDYASFKSIYSDARDVYMKLMGESNARNITDPGEFSKRHKSLLNESTII
jgi:hypothetical protein